MSIPLLFDRDRKENLFRSTTEGNLRWMGDFSVNRCRATLQKINDYPLDLNRQRDGPLNYTEDFSWDRGGVVGVPYNTKDHPPFPRTEHFQSCPVKGCYPTLSLTTRSAMRLPIINTKSGRMKRVKSCVVLSTPYCGEFSLKETEVPAEIKTKVTQKSNSFDNYSSLIQKSNSPPSKVQTDLWRLSNTSDAYFKVNVCETR